MLGLNYTRVCDVPNITLELCCCDVGSTGLITTIEGGWIVLVTRRSRLRRVTSNETAAMTRLATTASTTNPAINPGLCAIEDDDEDEDEVGAEVEGVVSCCVSTTPVDPIDDAIDVI